MHNLIGSLLAGFVRLCSSISKALMNFSNKCNK